MPNWGNNMSVRRLALNQKTEYVKLRLISYVYEVIDAILYRENGDIAHIDNILN